jgi:hypothetical protein
MHPCCWHNLLQTLAQLVPAFALMGVAGKKLFTALGIFWRIPAKKATSITESIALNGNSSEIKADACCTCEKEAVH